MSVHVAAPPGAADRLFLGALSSSQNFPTGLNFLVYCSPLPGVVAISFTFDPCLVLRLQV